MHDVPKHAAWTIDPDWPVFRHDPPLGRHAWLHAQKTSQDPQFLLEALVHPELVMPRLLSPQLFSVQEQERGASVGAPVGATVRTLGEDVGLTDGDVVVSQAPPS